jgi:hypothetical protein
MALGASSNGDDDEPLAAPFQIASADPGGIEAPAMARARAVRDGLIARGMQPDSATAFAANALHESSAQPGTGPGDAGASHGLFQWTGPRLAAFQTAYGGLLPERTPLGTQLDYVVSELNGPEAAARDAIMGANGPAEKAAAVSQFYLRPKDVAAEMQRRSATALQLASAWGSGGGTMAEDQSNYPPPYTGSGQQLTPSQIFGLLGIGPQQRDDTPQSFISRLGEAAGGGGGALTGADRESAGLRALSNLGIGLLSQSGWRKTPTTFGEVLGAGLSRAQQSEVESQNQLAAAQQARLGAVKDALNILNTQQGQALTARGQDITRASDIAAHGIQQQQATTEAGRLAVEKQKADLAAEVQRQELQKQKDLQQLLTPPTPPVAPSAPTAPTTNVPGQQGALPGGPQTTLMAGPGAPSGLTTPPEMPGTSQDVSDILKSTNQPPPNATIQLAGDIPPPSPTSMASQTQLPGNLPDRFEGPGGYYIRPDTPADLLQGLKDAHQLSPEADTALTTALKASLIGGNSADQARLIAENNQKRADTINAQIKDAQNRIDNWHKDAKAQQLDVYKTLVQGQQDRFKDVAATENAQVSKQQMDLSTQRDNARAAIDSATVVKALSDQIPKATALADVNIGGKSLLDLLVANGVGTKEQLATMSKQQVFRSAVNGMITDLRKGVQMGQLSDRDLSFISNMAPSLMEDASTRDAVLAYLQQAQYRKLHFADRVNELWDGGPQNGGIKWGKALDQARAEQDARPIIPTVPPEYLDRTQNPTDAPLHDWLRSNNVPAGTFVLMPRGRLQVVPAYE